jgi:tRNA-intron endonuclease, archaea type
MSNNVRAVYDDRIVVWEAPADSSIFGDAYYGKPLGIRKPRTAEFQPPLELAPYEALYLQEKGQLDVVDASGHAFGHEELVSRIETDYVTFGDLYRVYQDLRDKGYIARSGMKFGADFAVYEYGPGIDHAPFLVQVLPLKHELDPIEIVRAGRLSHSVRKRFVVAAIDPISREVTYYAFRWFKA